LLFFKFKFQLTNSEVWRDLYLFWVKIFALTFALGVVSGITMSFQFGTNWPGFMETVGNVAGPLLAYEVLTAFFMEATFLGVMLFGINRVPPWLHTLATAAVAIGTTISAFWIIVLNSWMHTPTGFHIVENVVHVSNWADVIFNPSMPYRLSHMLVASGLTTAFLIAGLSAWRSLKHSSVQARSSAAETKDISSLGIRCGVYVAAVLIPIQIFIGDLHGLNTLEHQPAKIAAMEGVWETKTRAPLLLFAIPDETARENAFEFGIPAGASLILKHDLDGEITGLNDFEHHPPVKPLFFGFRIMVGTGLLMLLVSWLAALFLWRNGTTSKRMNIVLIGMTFSGWIATLSGWYVTEIGRQPWLVYGLLTTESAVGPVASSSIAVSLFLYLVIYAFLLVAYVATLFYLAGQSKHRELSKGQDVSKLNASPVNLLTPNTDPDAGRSRT